MKEAAGEANMTVVTIILICFVLAVWTIVINGVMQRISNQADDATNGTVNTQNNNNTTDTSAWRNK